MVLIQILLPMKDENAKPFPMSFYDGLAEELTPKFGGVTGFMRAPAEGRWRNDGETERDEIIVLEVMAGDLDRSFWSALRSRLMRQLRQDDILIRCQPAEILK
jgi:hypothetical protein